MTSRRMFVLGLGTTFATPHLAFAAEGDQIEVSLDGVKNLKDLVAAMKSAAGDRAPATIKLKEVYGALAEAVLDSAQDAMAQGVELPAKVRRLIPSRQKTFLPVVVLVPLWGLTFVFEMWPFYTLILGSLTLMLGWITAKAEERRKRKLKAEAAPPVIGAMA